MLVKFFQSLLEIAFQFSYSGKQGTKERRTPYLPIKIVPEKTEKSG